LLPPFLRQLEPTMNRLGGLADQFTPVLNDVGSVAPDVNLFVTRLEPFSRASLPAFRSLGDAADKGRPVPEELRAVLQHAAGPHAHRRGARPDLRDLAVSLRDTGGIEDLMDFFFYLSGSTNGYDSVGHYFRVGVRALTACVAYSTKAPTTAQADCNANFSGPKPEDAKREAEQQKQQQQQGGGNTQAARVASATGGLLVRPGTAAPAPSSDGTTSGTAAEAAAGGSSPPAARPTQPSSTTSWAADVRRGSASIAANPVLIGAATVLVIIVAVFLAYNANNGLPFVPTYQLKAELPNAASLVKGNEVRVGGTRVGAIDDISAVVDKDGHSKAVITMQLERSIEPLPVDTTVLVRSRSVLGLKYVQLTKGNSSKGWRTAPRSRCARRGRSRSSSTSSCPPSTTRPARRSRRTRASSATASPAAGAT
jgi:ABC-type transporter Mla subunit MlaD